MKVKSKSIKTSWTTSGDSINREDFLKGIKKAEKGQFHTVSEAKKLLKQWREPKAGK